MATMSVIIGILVLILFWLYMSLTIVQPNQLGVKVFLGNPGKTVDSGLRFTIWPVQWIVLFPKGLMEFNFTLRSAMTKKGKVNGERDEIHPVEINISCTLYARFDENNLQNALKYGPGSTEEDLGRLIVPYAMGILRAFVGRVPWKLINQERRYVSEWITARLVPTTNGYFPLIDDDNNNPTIRFDTDPNNKRFISRDNLLSSPFVMSSLIDVSLAIKDIDFVDPEMDKAVTAAEKARQEVAAIRTRAEAERDRLKAEGEGAADARQKMIEVIKAAPDLEALFTLREMAMGTSNTILYQLPGAFEDKMKEVLGGNKPTDILKLLKPEDQKKILKAIEAAIKKRSN